VIRQGYVTAKTWFGLRVWRTSDTRIFSPLLSWERSAWKANGRSYDRLRSGAGIQRVPIGFPVADA
jgi:hypothetical protein